MRRLLTLLAVVLLVPSLRAQSVPATINPVGTFDFTTDVDGQASTGTIRIARDSTDTKKLVGELSISVAGQVLPMENITVKGNTVQFTITTNGGPAQISMQFTSADEFTGGWTMSGGGGAPLKGKRHKG